MRFMTSQRWEAKDLGFSPAHFSWSPSGLDKEIQKVSYGVRTVTGNAFSALVSGCDLLEEYSGLCLLEETNLFLCTFFFSGLSGDNSLSRLVFLVDVSKTFLILLGYSTSFFGNGVSWGPFGWVNVSAPHVHCWNSLFSHNNTNTQTVELFCAGSVLGAFHLFI